MAEKKEKLNKEEETVGGEQAEGVEGQKSDKGGEVVQEVGVGLEVNKDARMWAMFCHLAGVAGLMMPFVGNIIAPLVLWQIKKEDYPFVDEQGREATNFQISMTIYVVVSVLLSTPLTLCIGPFLLTAVVIFDVVALLIAAVKANNGQSYRYPLTIRLIK